MTLPSSSTTPPSTLVPPISTPIVNDTRAFLPRPRLRHAGATAPVARATLVVRRGPRWGLAASPPGGRRSLRQRSMWAVPARREPLAPQSTPVAGQPRGCLVVRGVGAVALL